MRENHVFGNMHLDYSSFCFFALLSLSLKSQGWDNPRWSSLRAVTNNDWLSKHVIEVQKTGFRVWGCSSGTF